jgi:cytochrome c553
MKFSVPFVASLLLAISLQAVAAGDAAIGQAKAAICAACHGADGNSTVPQWPKLAGQHADYIVREFNLIKAGHRPVPEMTAITPTIDEQDIENIAAWYSSQTIKGGVADKSALAIGLRLWRAGNARTGVPACMACHGPAGEGVPFAGFPALRGQHATYVASMLKRFRAGENWGEKDANSHIMDGVAARLTDDEINSVASVIEGLYRADN